MSSSAAVFAHSTKEEFLTLLPLKTSAKAVQRLWDLVMSWQLLLRWSTPLEKKTTTQKVQTVSWGTVCRVWCSPPPHIEVRWLGRLRYYSTFFLLKEIKAFMESREQDITLLSDAGWLLDLAFLKYVTEKLNHLNLQSQDKDKTTCDINTATKAFKAREK